VQKYIGLMFRKSFENKCMVFSFDSFKKRIFHTWFMRFPIDILFFDENMKLVHRFNRVKPWSLVRAYGKYVVEVKS